MATPRVFLLLTTLLIAAPSKSILADTARGRVFVDANSNRIYDKGEKLLPGVRVSNGSEIVSTDNDGQYELPVTDDTTLFLIKPRGYRSPLSKDMLPQFFYVHKPAGSPKLNFPGVEPTGPLPDSIDFPVYAQDEPETFEAIMFGDTQPRNQEEVDFIAHDVIEELVGTSASFGVTLGDIVFDNLGMMKPLNRTIALLGIPWYNVIGNHDINYDVQSRDMANETFERIYGPSYYSFDHGPVHFVVVDNIEWRFDDKKNKMAYRGGIGEQQLKFIRKDLALVPDDKLVVLMMHIPLTNTHDRQGLYKLIEKRKFCMSISGHTHHHEHVFITKEDGWQGLEPHHHVINVTVCGSWWSGQKDERGIPHTLMADGAPNGYSVISFNGSDYHVNFHPVGRQKSWQMQLHLPEVVTFGKTAATSLYANVFNGSEKTVVEMKVADSAWIPLKHVNQIDPTYQAIFDREAALLEKAPKYFRSLPKPKPSTHLWRVNLPANIPEGTHMVQVRATDTKDRIYHGRRILRVEK